MKHARARLTASIHLAGQGSGTTEDYASGTGRKLRRLFRDAQWTPVGIRAVMWRGFTVITCPCCIPIWLAVLSGTTVGALLSKNLFVTVVLFLALFALCFWKAIRSYDPQPESTVHIDHQGTR